MRKIIFVAISLSALLSPSFVFSQELTKEELLPVESLLNEEAASAVHVGKIVIDSTKVSDGKLLLFANTSCSYIPFRTENVSRLYAKMKQALPSRYANDKIELRTSGKSVEELIPRFYRADNRNGATFTNPCTTPLLTRLSQAYVPTKGLLNRHIAMWQSHGLYYEQGLARWEWQRARMFETVEDLYTQSYVLPFLVPMLENAGAIE